ncbi:acyl carrier protein [Streptomyces sp. RKAG293]|uniref:phosphopantetheine-binding protein n=1 Tax=Streptomyces sp. RKAG293 TaxID=2893403 RepID=UPI00203467B6|nr:acyl carrier protein [Streptomyces sp. RKAG293]MCM2416565.1 acyl carrier protein [Streptomyces sp. RKAG293]
MSPSYQIISDSLIKEFDVDPALVHPDAALESLQLDSLALVELSLMLEERLNMTVTDVPASITLAELVSLVDNGSDADDRVPAGQKESA